MIEAVFACLWIAAAIAGIKVIYRAIHTRRAERWKH